MEMPYMMVPLSGENFLHWSHKWLWDPVNHSVWNLTFKNEEVYHKDKRNKVFRLPKHHTMQTHGW